MLDRGTNVPALRSKEWSDSGVVKSLGVFRSFERSGLGGWAWIYKHSFLRSENRQQEVMTNGCTHIDQNQAVTPRSAG
jgi:hypothetical protein